jgi:nicotinamide riboside transporter PnuC
MSQLHYPSSCKGYSVKIFAFTVNGWGSSTLELFISAGVQFLEMFSWQQWQQQSAQYLCLRFVIHYSALKTEMWLWSVDSIQLHAHNSLLKDQ